MHRLGEQGIFHGGTRHLSQFTLRIGGKRPLLLSSTVSEDNRLLTVELANVELEQEGILVAAETLHVLRTICLWDGVCYERLDVRNYAGESLRTTLTCHLESDFRDLFEVRGMRRPRRGELARPAFDDERMRLAYTGLDGVTRATELDWSVPPLTATAGSVEFDVALAFGRCAEHLLENRLPGRSRSADTGVRSGVPCRSEPSAGSTRRDVHGGDLERALQRVDQPLPR